MSDSIDYSRPVGWWCPVCERYEHASAWVVEKRVAEQHLCLYSTSCAPIIPWFLPIPEGQRPPAASEVEEAEVVTYIVGRDLHAYGPPDPRLPWI